MVGDGIARAAGLDNCMAGELVQFESGAYGMAQNLEETAFPSFCWAMTAGSRKAAASTAPARSFLSLSVKG